MIWSEEELANMVIVGKDVAVDRVMKHLDEPINSDIFLEQNFSYLWGILGLSGLQGMSEKSKELVWTWLKENGVIDAYKKGQLGNFNKKLIAKYEDNRLTAWFNKDNFETERIFRTEIIEELAATNMHLAKEIAYLGCHRPALINTLIDGNLDDRVRFYLKYLLDSKDDYSSVVETMEFREVLRSLVQIIKYQKNKLKEEEKEFFYHYFKEALVEGEDRHLLGIDDDFFVLLMFDGELGEISEIEAATGLARNQEIREQVAEFENQDGFYDQTTAIYIRYEHEQVADLVNRCLKLAETGEKPRGVCFVLELVKLGQVKSAVLVLQQLANKGQALGCIGYLSWLLISAKGAERLIAEILVCNLNQMKKQHVRDNFEQKRLAYIAQFYLAAVEVFSNENRPEEAILLIQSLIEGGFLDGMRDNPDYFIYVINGLLVHHPDFKEELVKYTSLLGLKVLEGNEAILVVQEKENSLSSTYHRVERLIKDAAKLDFTHVIDKMADDKNEVYDEVQKPIGVFDEKNHEVELQPKEVLEDESLDKNDVSEVITENPSMSKENERFHRDDKSILEEEKSGLPVDNLQQITEDSEAGKIGKKDEILHWETEDSPIDDNDNKINIDNILEIKSDEVDKHFSKIKQITDAAIRHAEDKARAIKNKVQNAQNEFLSTGKFRNLVKKLKSFRKK